VLYLTRERGEGIRLRLGDVDVWVVVEETGNRVRIGIQAPREVRIDRAELLPYGGYRPTSTTAPTAGG